MHLEQLKFDHVELVMFLSSQLVKAKTLDEANELEETLSKLKFWKMAGSMKVLTCSADGLGPVPPPVAIRIGASLNIFSSSMF